MKYIQLKVDDDTHKEIKLKAIESGKSMNQYLIDCIFYAEKYFEIPKEPELHKEQPTPSKVVTCNCDTEWVECKAHKKSPSKVVGKTEYADYTKPIVDEYCKSPTKKSKTIKANSTKLTKKWANATKLKCTCFAADKGVHDKTCKYFK